MGIADVIPGVSGGTIAFITGIYDRLIHSIGSIDYSFLSKALRGKFKESWDIIRKIDFPLFIPLGLGIVVAIFLFSGVLTYLLVVHTALTFAFFFGLILGSVYFVGKQIGRFRAEYAVFAVFGFIVAYAIAGATALQVNHSLPVIFLSAVVAISAMILPGISGSFILLLLNQYEYVVGAVHTLNIKVLGVFILGAIVGLISFTKIVDHIMKKYRALTFSFLTGLMLGALRVPGQEVINNYTNGVFIGISALAGIIIVYKLEKVFMSDK